MNAPRPLINKRDIAASFGRAAPTYDAAATLQKMVCAELGALLDPVPPDPRTTLDLGCGTGLSTRELATRFPGAHHVGLDLAEGMVFHARSRPRQGAIHWLCADAEHLPFAEGSFDLVFSNLSLQWFPDPARAFAEAARTLAPGGTLCVSTLGPRTLHELRSAWTRVDGHVHVNRFQEPGTIHEQLERAGLECTAFRIREIVMKYPGLRGLTHELKAIGAHNLNHGRATGLTGRARLRALEAAYETWRSPDGLLPATYEAVFLRARKR